MTRHIAVGATANIPMRCPKHGALELVVRATGRGIRISQFPDCPSGCDFQPATALRYYLHGDDSVTVETR